MSDHPPSPHSSLQGRTVLLVENETLIVLDVTRALEREGARVIGASGVAQGLERLDIHRPDAAILDLRLGRGEDCELVARRLEELGIPYLVHTGDALRHAALLDRLGAPVLSKPYPSHHLAGRVAALLDAPPATDAAQSSAVR